MGLDEMVWLQDRRLVDQLLRMPWLPLQRADAPVTLFVQLWSFVSETLEPPLQVMNRFGVCHWPVEKGREGWTTWRRGRFILHYVIAQRVTQKEQFKGPSQML